MSLHRLPLLWFRPTVAPLDRLVRRMHTVGLLRPGQSLPESGGPQIVWCGRSTRSN